MTESSRFGFGPRLAAAVGPSGREICVGLDPTPELLAAWELADGPAGLAAMAERVIDALAGKAPVLKIQVAYFERHGHAGWRVLEESVQRARSAGWLVLLDAKRGDIGSTAAAYAQALLDPAGPVRADAVTVSPYLGFTALAPFVAASKAWGTGVFVLARTTESGGRALQEAVDASGRSVEQLVVDEVAAANRDRAGMGSVGVVVGALSSHSTPLELSQLGGPVLVPGIGAQGGGRLEFEAAASGAPLALASSSRALLAAGPSHGGLNSALANVRQELGL